MFRVSIILLCGILQIQTAIKFETATITLTYLTAPAGHGRNQIDRELREQGKGKSWLNQQFINAYKRKHEQPRPADTLTRSEPDFANTSYEQYHNTEPDASIISVKTKNSTIEEKDERCTKIYGFMTYWST
jgi:hypothetical protein